MTEQRDQPDDEHFSDWLFYRRRTPHRPRQRRITHATHSSTTNTEDKK